jgi:beta-1,4-mannosyltransferase
MRVLAFPKTGISYNDSFYDALERQGVTVVEGTFSGGWLKTNLQPGDWLHLHWPSFAYNVRGGHIRQLISFMRFVALLLLARILGGQIAWTAHNLLPHDRCLLPALDVLGRHILISLSRTILVHGPGPATALTGRFPRSKHKQLLTPHGHWIGYYPDNVSKECAREELNLPQDQVTFLFVGLCKPYKNLHQLIDTFAASDLNACLVVAGKFSSSTYRDEIEFLAKHDSRIRIDEGFIPDERIQYYLRAYDYVVVPYREILTSGTAMLALSFGRPLISVDLGFLRDVVPETVGILYSHTDPDGLSAALTLAVKTRFEETRILAYARLFSFEDAAQTFAEALRLNSPASPNSTKSGF